MKNDIDGLGSGTASWLFVLVVPGPKLSVEKARGVHRCGCLGAAQHWCCAGILQMSAVVQH